MTRVKRSEAPTSQIRTEGKTGGARSNDTAFTEIVRDYKDRIFSLAYRVLGDHDEADECAQEIFIRIHGSLSTFRGESALSTWIYRVAYNVSIDFARKKKRAGTHEDHGNGDCPPDLPDMRANPETIALRNEEIRTIMDAIAKIDPDQRGLIIMFDIEGKDYEEIRAITGLAMGTVKSRIARGRMKLRELLRGTL